MENFTNYTAIFPKVKSLDCHNNPERKARQVLLAPDLKENT
jgi:hypothetical protein